MAAFESISGLPGPDETGTLRLRAVEKDGEVSLEYGRHRFVRVRVEKGEAIIEVFDVDRERPVYVGNVSVLCWQR